MKITLALIYWPSTSRYTVWAFDENIESYERWENRIKNNEIFKANHCNIQIIEGVRKDL